MRKKYEVALDNLFSDKVDKISTIDKFKINRIIKKEEELNITTSEIREIKFAIREKYKEKIESTELLFEEEVNRLEFYQGTYISETGKNLNNYYISVMVTLISILIASMFPPDSRWQLVVCVSILIIYLYKVSIKDKILDYANDYVIDLAKEVLDDFKKENIMMKKYNKLVRDKIPEIIAADGKECEVKIVKGKDKYDLLEKKLKEEVNEFLEDKNLEELADVMEVLFGLANELGYSEAELAKKREEKKSERGGFKEGIVLKEVKN